MNSIPHFRFVHRTGNLITSLSLLVAVTSPSYSSGMCREAGERGISL